MIFNHAILEFDDSFFVVDVAQLKNGFGASFEAQSLYLEADCTKRLKDYDGI